MKLFTTLLAHFHIKRAIHKLFTTLLAHFHIKRAIHKLFTTLLAHYHIKRAIHKLFTTLLAHYRIKRAIHSLFVVLFLKEKCHLCFSILIYRKNLTKFYPELLKSKLLYLSRNKISQRWLNLSHTISGGEFVGTECQQKWGDLEGSGGEEGGPQSGADDTMHPPPTITGR